LTSKTVLKPLRGRYPKNIPKVLQEMLAHFENSISKIKSERDILVSEF
jgi:hypothetical protein